MSAVASYVQQREGELFVGESQVTVESVIANWQRGATTERIQGSTGGSRPTHKSDQRSHAILTPRHLTAWLYVLHVPHPSP